MALKFDDTGINPITLFRVKHTFVANDLHILVPVEGVFYLDSMSVVSTTTGLPVAWSPWVLDEHHFALTGKAVAVSVAIDDVQSSDTVILSYQAVDGPLSTSSKAYQLLVDAIEAATTGSINWSRVKHPATFSGFPHTHPVTDNRT